MKTNTKSAIRGGVIGLLAVFGLGMGSSSARSTASGVSANSSAEVRESPSHSKVKFGLGVSGTSGLTPSPTAGARSAEASLWVEFNETSALQGLFGIATTSPFVFGAGAIYKHNLIGSWSQGFHVGGGTVLGAGSNGFGGTVFVATLAGVAGLHFKVPSVDHVMLQADLGPALAIQDGSASFAFGTFGPFLGLSVHYIF